MLRDGADTVDLLRRFFVWTRDGGGRSPFSWFFCRFPPDPFPSTMQDKGQGGEQSGKQDPASLISNLAGGPCGGHSAAVDGGGSMPSVGEDWCGAGWAGGQRVEATSSNCDVPANTLALNTMSPPQKVYQIEREMKRAGREADTSSHHQRGGVHMWKLDTSSNSPVQGIAEEGGEMSQAWQFRRGNSSLHTPVAVKVMPPLIPPHLPAPHLVRAARLFHIALPPPPLLFFSVHPR
jgi:hypothetical protein